MFSPCSKRNTFLVLSRDLLRANKTMMTLNGMRHVRPITTARLKLRPCSFGILCDEIDNCCRLFHAAGERNSIPKRQNNLFDPVFTRKVLIEFSDRLSRYAFCAARKIWLPLE